MNGHNGKCLYVWFCVFDIRESVSRCLQRGLWFICFVYLILEIVLFVAVGLVQKSY